MQKQKNARAHAFLTLRIAFSSGPWYNKGENKIRRHAQWITKENRPTI